jgi:hypothetical protein
LRRTFLVASLAIQFGTEASLPPFFRDHPGPYLPRRTVPDMLAVPAIEIGHPVVFLVLVKRNDFALHASPPRKDKPGSYFGN